MVIASKITQTLHIYCTDNEPQLLFVEPTPVHLLLSLRLFSFNKLELCFLPVLPGSLKSQRPPQQLQGAEQSLAASWEGESTHLHLPWTGGAGVPTAQWRGVWESQLRFSRGRVP